MRKKHLCLSAVLLAAFAAFPPAVAAQTYWTGEVDTEFSGDGTEASPYLITSAEELAGLAKRANADETFEGKFIKLTTDVYLSDPSAEADDKPLWVPIASLGINNDDSDTNPGNWYKQEHWFKGTFDGGGHTIHNLWYKGETNWDDFNDPFGSGQIDFSAFNIALFGGLKGATIKNLNVKDLNIGGAIVAGLAIEAYDSDFTDIDMNGHVKSGDLQSGGSASGMIYEAYNCNLLRCKSSVNTYSYSGSAPLVGYLKAGSTVTDCHTTGEATGCVHVSGFICSTSAWPEGNDLRVPVIRNSSSSGLVTIIFGRNQGNDGAGFVAYNAGEIYNSHSKSNVHVTRDVGAGFCYQNIGHIESCYALGDIYNEDYGVSLNAFVSSNGLDAGWSEYYPGTILNCYGAGKLTAPDAPTDVITTPTSLNGFATINNQTTGSVMANCYYDSTKNPKIRDNYGAIGSFGASTEFMQSKEFVDSLNAMAAIMGTSLWQYNAGDYPTPTGVKATDVSLLFAGGEGTAEKPFLISNKKQLENLAYATNRNWFFRDQYIKQTADIALNQPQENWGEEMPTQWIPIGHFANDEREYTYHFCGHYDGDFHTVSSLYIDNTKMISAGLFGVLGGGAEIKNLGVTDAWIKPGSWSGIIAGSLRRQNDSDQFKEGATTISHCWSTGQISGGYFAPGAIIGAVNNGDDISINACYSTAKAVRGLLGEMIDYDHTCVNGCWFGGTNMRSETKASYFETYIDTDKNPDILKDYVVYGTPATTEHMQTSQFVNTLNYAAAYKGFEGGWRYNAGNYPSFTTGSEPTVEVSFNDGVNDPLTFKAIAGSTISAPVTPEKEGEVCTGWYTDEAFTSPFVFDKTPVEKNVTLYARWANEIVPDVSIFKNKFTETYTIKTVEQLYGLAAIVNGETTEVDRTDFKGKTIKLGNDLTLNDISDYDRWGTSVSPLVFNPIAATGGFSSDNMIVFNGIFDGQGHTIDGLYLNPNTTGNIGLFGYVGESGEIKNLVVDHAYMKIDKKPDNGAAFFSSTFKGKMSRCGVTGKVSVNITEKYGCSVSGLIYSVENNASVTECYANVDMNLSNLGEGACYARGLFGIVNSANTENNFVRGSIHFDQIGSFGSIAGSVTSKSLKSSYGAVSVSWEAPYKSLYIGGAFASGPENDVYYDLNLVKPAFSTMPEADAKSAYNKGIGLFTAEMKTMKAMETLDFETVWGRRDDINDGYPYLRWTNPGLENDPDAEITIPVESVTLDKTSIEGKAGDTVQLTATVTPEKASDKSLQWLSSNPEVATVDENGLVTLVADGTATISVSAESNADAMAECTVTVTTPIVAVSRISIDPRRGNGYTGETVQLTATISPSNATDKSITWTSDNESVATVDETGLVTITGEGEATITATASNGVTATARITGHGIKEIPVESVLVNKASIKGNPGDMIRLTATVMPEDATNQEVIWSSSNPDVARVDDDGMVTLIASGTAKITVTSKSNPDAFSRCNVTVTDEEVGIMSVEIVPPTAEGFIGETVQLSATVTPADATDQALTWASSDESVATVDENGLVTITGKGLATVTATASNGVSGQSEITGLEKEDDPGKDPDDSAISEILAGEGEVSVFTTSGQLIYIGPFGDANLLPGLYIVSNGEKVVKMHIK